jgi:hypothetical protein
MAASRSSTPVLTIRSPYPNPHPKPTLTIEEWEAKAPLGDTETKSIAAIKTASERGPDLRPWTVRVCFSHYAALKGPQKLLAVFARISCLSITPVNSPTTRQTWSRLTSFHPKFASTSSCSCSLCACPSPKATRPNPRAVLRLVRAD